MKTRNLFVALAILAGVHQTNAGTVFPIATNPAVVQIGWNIVFGGTNYLVSYVSGTNKVWQLISTNGALLGSPVVAGTNVSFSASGELAFGATNYLAVWSDDAISGAVDMFGQFISQGGAKVGPAFQLLSTSDYNNNGHGFQTVEALATDGTNFLVGWQDGSSGNFYGQLVTPSGTLSGQEFIISSGQSGNSNTGGGDSIAIAFGRTNYLAVWQSQNGGSDYQTYGELTSLNGVAGSPFQINQTASVDGYNPINVAFDGTNYLAAWNRDAGSVSNAPEDWEIFGRLVSQTGAFPGNELQLVTDQGSQILPELAFDGANYLMAWGAGSFNPQAASPTVNFQFFNRSGTPDGSEFTVFNAQGTNSPLLAGLVFDGTRFVAVATLGTIITGDTGSVVGFSSGEVFGAFISKSVPPPPFTILHSFTALAPGASTNSDGANPYAGLILSDGTLYDTAAFGGGFSAGTVYKVGTGGKGFTNLYNFTAPIGSDGIFQIGTNSDGANPYTGIVIAGSILYGTAYAGGTNGNGTIFAINTNGTGFAILHTFPMAVTNLLGLYTNNDGAGPNGLILSGDTLYGMAAYGGSSGTGTIFKINTNGTGFAVLHNFTALDSATGTTNGDGAYPFDTLTLSGVTLYGAAAGGGFFGYGTIFRINTGGAGFTNLYNFTGGNDGADPYAGFISSGNILYGTTFNGGSDGYGTVFAVNTNGAGFTVVHAFSGGNDGANPDAALVLSGGALYSTATYGGNGNYGTVFTVNTDGTGFTVLHNFTNGRDGANPWAGLILSGNVLYGAAEGGGSGGKGTIFSIWLGPTIQFTASPIAGLSPLTVQFNSPGVDSSGNVMASWNWNFDDGSTSTLQNPAHIYMTNGTFSPGLVAVNNSGVAVLASGPSITVGNLVANGGFETGDFTGWNTFGDTSYVFVDDGSDIGIVPYSGTYLAALGTSSSLGYLKQTLTTVSGQSYLLSLELDSPDGLTPNEFVVIWNGNTLFDQLDMPAIGWTNLQFVVTATGTNTILEFGFRDDPTYLALDDVSVLPVLVAPHLTILHSGPNVVLAWPTNATGFTLQSTTNLAAPEVWSVVSPTPTVAGGQNAVTNAISGKVMFYRLSQ